MKMKQAFHLYPSQVAPVDQQQNENVKAALLKMMQNEDMKAATNATSRASRQ